MSNTTALQDLIKWLDPAFKSVRIKATELLDKERSIIIDAFNQGYREGEALEESIRNVKDDVANYADAEKYYNDNFNNQ